MKETFEHEANLRRYLLADLPNEEQEQIEARLLVDSAYLEQLEIVEEELIDAYLREKLSPAERANFEQQFHNTPERQKKLALAKVLRDHLPSLAAQEIPAPSAFSRVLESLQQLFAPPVLKFAAASLVLIFGVGVWWLVNSQSAPRQGLNALNAAYGEMRPIEARITGFSYAPFLSGGNNNALKVNSAKLSLADKIFDDLADSDRSPAALHALGKFQLTEKHFDEAIKYLTEGLSANPQSAVLQTDLGVALLERGKLAPANSAQAQADFQASQQHLTEALRLSPASLDAAFNLALLYQVRGSWREATESWQKYLAKDASSAWATDARQYLEIAKQNLAR